MHGLVRSITFAGVSPQFFMFSAQFHGKNCFPLNTFLVFTIFVANHNYGAYEGR